MCMLPPYVLVVLPEDGNAILNTTVGVSAVVVSVGVQEGQEAGRGCLVLRYLLQVLVIV